MQSLYRKCMVLFFTFTASAGMAQAQTIEPVNLPLMKLIYVTDTAHSTQEIPQKMGKNYGILFSLVGRLQLKPNKTMGIYHTNAAPWIFDVAVEVDKEPEQLSDGVKFKSLEGGEAIVMHYKGAYEQMDKAYQQMEDWLTKHKKQRVGSPIEVYLNDPATVKDKSELLTDVYQLIL